ncbi:MAG: DUF2480 family protein [Chitinophagaceae bacterium]|nr:DUF2480 family protein [Chitinophagaceae bacterium]
MEPIVNKVADSGIITLNLETFIPQNVMVFDLKTFLFMELILKEKDYRAALMAHDWSVYDDQDVILTCSTDAIIPVWAYMLAMSYLQPVAHSVRMGDIETCKTELMLDRIREMDTSEFADQRVVIKGCGEIPIPDQAYAAITLKLRPVVKSLMYGEPCSTVPIYKKKTLTTI